MPDPKRKYVVEAHWDREAEVWVATSDDVPGLATEAETLDDLSHKLQKMIPELLELNGCFADGHPDSITFEVVSHKSESVAV